MVRNRKETTEKSKKKLGLSTQIFIALLAGALLGVVIHYWIPSSYIKDTVIVEGVLYVICLLYTSWRASKRRRRLWNAWMTCSSTIFHMFRTIFNLFYALQKRDSRERNPSFSM